MSKAELAWGGVGGTLLMEEQTDVLVGDPLAHLDQNQVRGQEVTVPARGGGGGGACVRP